MPAPQLRIGVIGLGYVATRCHLPAIRQVQGLHLVAVADPDPARLVLAPGVRASPRWETVVEASDIDAVIVATPSDTHVAIGLAVLAAGKHLLLEKPIALTVEDGHRLCEAEATSNRIAAVGLYLRHLRMIQSMAGKIAALGTPLVGSSLFHNHIARRQTVTGYEQHRATGGGVLYDLAYHHFDLYSFLFDSPVATVDCRLESRITEDDVAHTRVHLANGLALTGSFCSASYNENRLELYGTHGRLSADMYRGMGARFRSVSESHPARLSREVLDGFRSLGTGAHVIPAVKLQPFSTQLRQFREAILGRPATIPRMQDGLRALQAVEAAYRSSAQRVEIAL